MAISPYALKLIAPHLKGAEVLSLGYPELLLSGAQVEELFSFTPTKFMRKDAGKRHNTDAQLPDTIEIMEAVCKRFHCIDVEKFEGMEEVANLNYPQSLGQYDVVLDPGTLEHCWNIGQAWMNVAEAVKPGGRIMHLSPVSMVNHGFWNFCPTAFHDFYKQNKWVVEHMEFFISSGGVEKTAPCKGRETLRYKVAPENGMICIARRETDAPRRQPDSALAARLRDRPTRTGSPNTSPRRRDRCESHPMRRRCKAGPHGVSGRRSFHSRSIRRGKPGSACPEHGLQFRSPQLVKYRFTMANPED